MCINHGCADIAVAEELLNRVGLLGIVKIDLKRVVNECLRYFKQDFIAAGWFDDCARAARPWQRHLRRPEYR
jgi:hypothetical protein